MSNIVQRFVDANNHNDKYITKRKNMSKLHNILEGAHKNGSLKEGDSIRSEAIIKAIEPEIDEWFDRSVIRDDNNGPIRAISDLLGKHGLNLRKIAPKRYAFPKELPIVKDDKMYKQAEYTDN